jgi:hypothetical protein
VSKKSKKRRKVTYVFPAALIGSLVYVREVVVRVEPPKGGKGE